MNPLQSVYPWHQSQRRTVLAEPSTSSILWNEGYINGYKILEKSNELKLFLKYDKNCVPSIANVKSLSKPGRREYLSYKTLCNISYETGLIIISTSKGVLTLADCKKQKLGGEPLIIIV